MTSPSPDVSPDAPRWRRPPPVARAAVGRWLRHQREQTGRSPEQAAARAGVRTARLTAAEQGRTSLPETALTTLLHLYRPAQTAGRTAELAKNAAVLLQDTYRHTATIPAGIGQELLTSLLTVPGRTVFYTSHTLPAVLRAPGAGPSRVPHVHPELSRQTVTVLLADPVLRRPGARGDLLHLAGLADAGLVTVRILPAGSATGLPARLVDICPALQLGRDVLAVTPESPGAGYTFHNWRRRPPVLRLLDPALHAACHRSDSPRLLHEAADNLPR
ncbi:helix-turn-helix domain-containing protein [Streptomyces uncialis]|uniref:helix-turn-helix domain-containing protein n=1 Tax=Streptomyces uncialis TaxID=1048205 RepID=UPI0037F53D42